jgi:Cu(I)/Ag(I) efflux system periplasmic protein CusF
MSPSMKLVALLAAQAMAMSIAAHAQSAAASAPTAAPSGKPGPAKAAGVAALARGEVLEVDRKEQRVLMKHGPIQSIGMDAMTMEFRVPDRKLLALLKRGAKVRFAAAYKDGDYEITRVELVKRSGARR